MFLVMQQFFSRLCVCLCICVKDFFSHICRLRSFFFSIRVHLCEKNRFIFFLYAYMSLFSDITYIPYYKYIILFIKTKPFQVNFLFFCLKSKKCGLLDRKAWSAGLEVRIYFDIKWSFLLNHFFLFPFFLYVTVCMTNSVQLFGIDDRVDGQMTLRKQTNKNIYLFFIERLHITDQKVRLSCSFFLLFSVVTIFILWF